MNIRVGQGFDTHAFQAPGATDRPLIVGGVRIPHDRSLAAHSDGDVLFHAVCDALLGAAGLGDIGQHFPDTDPAWQGADSRQFLIHALKLLQERGWQPVNVDATVIAQAPRLGPYRDAMRAGLAAALALPETAVNIKFTTTEHLGFTGRSEGLAAMAVVLIRDD